MKIMFLVPPGLKRSHARFRVAPLVAAGQKLGLDIFARQVPARKRDRYSFFSRLPGVDVLVLYREFFSSYELGNLRRLCRTMVYDCSDASWTLPEHERKLGSQLALSKLSRRFMRVCKAADFCVVDNRALAEVVSQYAQDVRVIPTPVDVGRYVPGDGGKSGGVPLVGWMGTPGDEVYLQDAMHHLESFAGQIQFSVVSREPYSGPGQEFVFWNMWSGENEPRLLQAMDIGVLPMPETGFTRSCSGVDLLKFMACGVAVVASDVGAHREIIDHGIDGFLIREGQPWGDLVMRLVEDRTLRRTMAENGRRKVEEKFSLETIAPQFWRAFGV